MNSNRTNLTARGAIQCESININLLKANDFVAEGIRKKMSEENILLLNITSSPGSGKTTLLEKTAEILKDKMKIKVLVGDLETERDAQRIQKSGIESYQIVTGGVCHLEAQMISQAIDSIGLQDVDLLIIENVGNLVCPSSFDLGEDFRVVLISCTEGDDKPKKYPKMFLTSDLMVISKIDLLPYVPFSVKNVKKDALEVNHDLEVMQISSTGDKGIDEWCAWLEKKVKKKGSQ